MCKTVYSQWQHRLHTLIEQDSKGLQTVTHFLLEIVPWYVDNVVNRCVHECIIDGMLEGSLHLLTSGHTSVLSSKHLRLITPTSA